MCVKDKVSTLPVVTPMAPMAPSEGKKLNGTTAPSPAPAQQPPKKSPNDFIFGRVIGEGSFSTVYLAKDIHTGKEYAIKVCEKRHMIREKKTVHVKREKDVLNLLTHSSFYAVRPGSNFFLKLSSTFQDMERLYFVLTYAKNGELLPYINKVGSFDVECTRFYSGEILVALEHLHRLNIIHRDLKPENILLDENMHILIGDFGSSKILNQGPPSPPQSTAPSNQTLDNTANNSNNSTDDDDAPSTNSNHHNSSSSQAHHQAARERRRNSFVGTAQYVSPELLSDKTASPASDLWALGCIVYQMISGLPPFRSRSEYIIFQKILKLEYEFPQGFSSQARDLVQSLLVLDPQERLGAKDLPPSPRYDSIRSHPFYKGIDFDSLHKQTPPTIYPYLPGTNDSEDLRSIYNATVPDHLEPGLNDRQLTRLLGLDLQTSPAPAPAPPTTRPRRRNHIADLTEEERATMLKEQIASNKFSSLVSNNLILKQGNVDKRKGLFSRRRTLMLTTGPHLYYVDPASMILKGEIPFSPEMRVEPKNFKIFFVHTPNRTYYLEDPEGYSLEWCKAIEEMRIHTYGGVTSDAESGSNGTTNGTTRAGSMT
uniref:3-phosphoinositide-dependent protein kinase 1 n=1 Tax=Cacopsylla melanoneura TaxID=428564 RepID=A0A8D8V3Y5_9HEMI